jgi:hypothetical protein
VFGQTRAVVPLFLGVFHVRLGGVVGHHELRLLGLRGGRRLAGVKLLYLLQLFPQILGQRLRPVCSVKASNLHSGWFEIVYRRLFGWFDCSVIMINPFTTNL